MTPRDVMASGAGWYWWRMGADWPWSPVEVQCKNGEWRADGLLLDCPVNRKLERGGEYDGPIYPPDERGGW